MRITQSIEPKCRYRHLMIKFFSKFFVIKSRDMIELLC